MSYSFVFWKRDLTMTVYNNVLYDMNNKYTHSPMSCHKSPINWVSGKYRGILRIHNDLSAVWKRLHKYLPFLSEGCTEQTVKSTSVSNNISF